MIQCWLHTISSNNWLDYLTKLYNKKEIIDTDIIYSLLFKENEGVDNHQVNSEINKIKEAVHRLKYNISSGEDSISYEMLSDWKILHYYKVNVHQS